MYNCYTRAKRREHETEVGVPSDVVGSGVEALLYHL
jgi:hypothetical protein